ncbi:hypothetical protein BESB_063430 [Besnoitia besnoiti]|uniref:Transmembrane protein n=1 Tax=Besnoitia besnoiti TaxID=94643 RepID=A0A2A9MHM8_BESBE|nr:hypothetical protein BESB_063430 [Besnoitia besnoiti]PFH35456.1 hypothetical protein BESB_063430 [Besnoitia besnoiti]
MRASSFSSSLVDSLPVPGFCVCVFVADLSLAPPALLSRESLFFGAQFLAWFVAARRSQGRLTASLMHVGSLASSAAPNASWKPPAPLSISLRFRVVDPVSLLFFPRESAPAPEGEEGVRLSTDQPLLLPPLHSFIVEPWGGSGRYTLTSSDPSLVTVAPLSASPASPPFASSNLLSPLGWGVNTPTPGSASPPAHAARPRFRLETTAAASAERVRKKGGRPATGAAVLRLQDARQPQNSFEFLVIVAEPERVEITVDTYLIQQGEASYREDGRREALDAAQANMQQRAAKADGPVGGQTPREDVTHAIAVVTAYARIPPTLALPANVSNWLSQSSLSSSAGPRLTSLDAAARAVRRAASKWSEEVSEEDATEEDAWVSRHPLHLRPLQFASCNNLALLRGTAEATDDSPQFWTDAPGVLAISELRSALPYTCGVFRLTGTAPGSARFFFSASPRSAAAPAAGALTASVALDVFPPLEAWVLLDRLFLPAPLPSRKSPHLLDSLLDFAGPSEGGEAASTSWTAGEAEPGDTREGALHRIERRGLPRGAVAAGLPSRASPLLYSAPVSAVASRYREASASSAPAAGGARASEEILTLAVGSSLTFFTKGGPPDRPSAYVQLHGGELEPDAPEGTARVGLVSGDSEDFLRVVCLQPGTAAAKVALKTTTLPRKHIDVDAVSTSVRVWIMCSIPEHIEIFPLPTFSSLFGVAASSSSPRAPAALSPSSSFPLTPATVSFPQISPLSLSSPSTPSLFLRCGATHRFFFVSYDANLRPMLNVTSFFSSSPDTWELAGVPAPADQARGAQTDRDRASLVPFFGADSDSGGAGRRAAGAKETAKTEAFAAVDGVGVAVDSEACCGTLSLSVHLTWPAETAAALRDAALQEDAQRLLLSSLDAARESLRQRENRDASGALRSSAWRGDKLAETLFLVVLPPSRFFVPPPSPAFVPGFFPPLGDPAVSALAPQPSPDAAFPVRLFYHPQLVYRLLLQFTSPHSQVKARAASTSFSSGPSSVFGLFVETPGPRLLADGASHSAFFSALSPDQTLARFEARFRAAYRGDRAAASSPADARAESTRAPFPQDGLDVTSLVLRSADASQKPHPQSLPAALFPLRRPYAWPRGAALCSATCPLTEQEVWVVPPVTASSSGAERPETGEEDESAPPRRGRPAASGLLTVEDAGMVGDDAGLVVPGAEEEAAERKSAPTRTLELQFLRVERVSLSVLPPESLLAGSRRREAESRARHGWISGNWGEIEKGRTYGVKVDVIASDGAKLDPAFFRAMDLSLKISRNPKRRGGDAPLSGGRQQPVDESDGRGFVYVQRTRDRQAAATQARGASAGGGGAGEQGYSSSLETPSAAAETSATYAEVSFGPRSGAASAAFPADRSGLAPAKLLWHAEMETLLASSGFCSAAPGAEPAAEGERRVVPSAEGDECPDFLFYVDGFDADTELLLTVQATNWSLDASAQLVASAVSAEMVLALYPPLKIFPSSLVMLPGGHSLQLTIRGGPRHSARRRDEDLESDAQASRRRFTAIRRCESSDASVVAARAVEVLGAPVLAAFDARKLLLKVMTGDEEDDSPPDPREPVAQVVELVTGGEGSATLTVRVGDSSHDFPVAATSAASASSQFLGLRQAAATVQVIVALPARVVVGSRSRVPGGNRFVEAHRERVARFEANGPASAADPDGAAAHRDDADDTVRVGVHLTQRLHAFLYDAEGREFLFGHLAAPTGAVGDPGLDQETRGGQRRLQQLGVSASLPPPSASLCTYTWRAVKEDGATPVFGFVDARAIDLARGASRASSESCSNASAMPFLPAATTVRRTLSGTGEAASVSIVGLREGTARLHLRVQCAPREGAQTQRSRQVVLETEVSVVVSSLPLFASPTPSSALLQPASLTAHAGASSTSPASGPLSPLPLATPSGPAWWADLLAASPSSLSSLLVAPAAEYRLPCCRVRLVPAPAADAKPSASCPCSDGPAGPAVDAKASQAAAASQEASAPGAPGCACAPQAKAWAAALRVLAGDGGFVTGAAASSSVVRLEALPAASLALFGASLSPGERAKNNQTDDASRARAPTWTVVRVDVAPVANIELILKERTLQRGEKVTAHVVLKDREGRQIVSPTDLRIDVFSSHPSVVSAEVDLGRAFEPPAVLIQASSFLSGCAAVTVFLLSPATSSHFFADTVRLCTDSRVYPSDLPVAALAETDGRRVSASRRLLALPGTAVHLLPEARVPVAQSPPHLSFRLTFRLESLLSSLLSLAMQERRGDRSLHEQPSPLFPAALWKRARETAYSPASPDCLSLLSVARLVDLFAPSLGESLHLSLSSVFASMRRKASAQAAVYSPAFSVGDPLIHFSDDAASTSAWFLHLKRGLCARHAPVGRAARASCATGTARCASESSPSFLPVSVSFRVTLHDLPAVLASLVFSEESERAASDEQHELPEVRLRVDGVDLLFSALRKRLAAAWWSEQAAYRQQTDSAGGERGPAKSSATLGGCANGSSADRRSFSPLSPFFSMTGFLDWSSSFSPSRRSASPALFAEYLSSSPFFECPQPALLWWQTSHPELLSVATPASATATRLAPAHATSPRLSAAGVDGPVAVAQRTGHATVFASHQSSVLDVEILSWREARDGEGDADARDPERVRVVAAAGCAARFARGDAESRRASLLAVPSTAWAPLREGAVTSLPRLERLGGCAEDRRNTGAAASSGGGEERSARPFALGRLGGSGDLGGDAGRSPAGELLFFRLQASQAAGGSWTDVASSVYVHSGGGIQCAVSDPRLAPLFVTESTQLPLLSLDVEAETGEESPTGSRMSGKARHGETATLSTLREDVDQLLVSHACAFQERRLLSVESDLPTLLRISQTSSSVAGAAGDGRAQRANPPGALPAGRLPCGAASLSAASSFRDDGRRAAAASPAPLLDSLSLPVSVSVSTGLAPSLLALSPASLAAFTEPDGGPEAGNASAEIALQRAKSRFLLRETPPAQLCAAIPYKPQMRVLFDSRYMRLDEPPVLYVGETQRMSAGCSAPGETKETSEPASGGGGDRDDLFEEADVADSSSQCRRAAEGSGEEQGTAGAGFASVQESRAGEGAMLPLTVFVYPVPPVVSREGGASASAAEVSVDVGVSSDAYAVRAQQKGLLLAVRVEAALSRAAASPGDRRGGADSDREENASRAGRGYAWEAPESAQLTIESREWKQRLTLTLQRGRKVDRQRERAEEKREEQRLLFPPLLFSSSSSKLPAARRESEASGGGPHARPAPEESDAKGETSEQRERSDASGSLWEWTILLVLLIAGLVCVLPHVCGFCQRRSPQFSPCHPCGGPSPGTSAAIDSSPLFASTKATAQGPALILKEKARLETARMADAEALSCLFSASRFGGRGADLNCSVGRTPQQTLQMQPDGQWKWVAADQGEGSSQETLWRQEGSVARKHYS